MSIEKEPRLYLITPEIVDARLFTDRLAKVLATLDVPAVLLNLAEADEAHLARQIKLLAPIVQNAGAALLLKDRPKLVAHSAADGAHISGIDEFQEARVALQPNFILGAGGLVSRHDAMLAGDGNADYLMFGEPNEFGERPRFETVLERVAWWAEVFVIPCVAYASEFDEVRALVDSGADFIAVDTLLWDNPEGVEASLKMIAGELRSAEPAT